MYIVRHLILWLPQVAMLAVSTTGLCKLRHLQTGLDRNFFVFLKSRYQRALVFSKIPFLNQRRCFNTEVKTVLAQKNPDGFLTILVGRMISVTLTEKTSQFPTNKRSPLKKKKNHTWQNKNSLWNVLPRLSSNYSSWKLRHSAVPLSRYLGVVYCLQGNMKHT